jgi:hypothetical protein
MQKILFSTLFLFCMLLVSGKAKDKEENKSGKSANKKEVARKKDPNDFRGLAAFFLQDPKDDMCLSPHGFVTCDENALWLLTTRSGRNTYSLVSFLNPSSNICLQRKTKLFGLLNTDQLIVGSCNTASAKSWQWEWSDDNVKLTNLGKCLVRGKNGIKNSMSVEDCGGNNKKNFLALKYRLTAVHESGFLLVTADGQCFDGEKMRSCFVPTGGSSAKKSSSVYDLDHSTSRNVNAIPYSLYWGIGLKYVWGEAKRYIYNFALDANNNVKCLSYDKKTNKVMKGDCSSKNSLTWGLQHGKLSVQNGQKCVSRRTQDDTALLTNCQESYEHMAMNVPVSNDGSVESGGDYQYIDLNSPSSE